jgi:outer membrane murein-binding lipoprotein Lpp
MNTAMSALKSLERRVEHLLAEHAQLRRENAALRDQAAQLQTRIDTTAQRLETLRDALPGD